MLTTLSTSSPSPSSTSPSSISPSLLLELEAGYSERPRPPIPTFVHLSRLVDPELQAEQQEQIDPDIGIIDIQGTDTTDGSVTNGVSNNQTRNADSLGRPLYQIGLAAMVAATALGVYTFAPLPNQTWSGVEPTIAEPGSEPISSAAVPTVSPQANNQAAEGSLSLGLFGAQQASSGADLTIVGTASSDGETVRWTATIRNQGPGTASKPIRFIQTLPAGIEFVSFAGNDWTCSFNAAASTISCDLETELAVGQRRQLGLVTTDGGAMAGVKLPTTMSVIGRNSDTDLADNTIDVVAIVAKSSDSTADSRSTGTTSSGAEAVDAQSADNGLEELPKTGAGLTALLAAAGAAMCLAGRRMLRASAENQPIAIATRIRG